MDFTDVISKYNSKQRQNALEEIAWFKSQPTVKKAVELAALAQNERGKRYSHQCRIQPTAIIKAKAGLLAATKKFEQCKDFDGVHRLVKRKLDKVHGIGELFIYDAAFRIGAKLNLFPQRVYLHAGTRRGASVLGLKTTAGAIEIKDLPQGLKHLPPHEVEDILCIFKKNLSNTKNMKKSHC